MGRRETATAARSRSPPQIAIHQKAYPVGVSTEGWSADMRLCPDDLVYGHLESLVRKRACRTT